MKMTSLKGTSYYLRFSPHVMTCTFVELLLMERKYEECVVHATASRLMMPMEVVMLLIAVSTSMVECIDLVFVGMLLFVMRWKVHGQLQFA